MDWGKWEWERGEQQRGGVQESQKRCRYHSHVGCSSSFPRWHFSNSTAGLRVSSQGSWAITAAVVTPSTVATSVRYITKVQEGSNVALLDTTPNGSAWCKTTPYPFGHISLPLVWNHHFLVSHTSVPAEWRKVQFNSKIVKGLSATITYKTTTWKVNNSLVIRDLSETSQSSGLNPCSATVFLYYFWTVS